MNTERIYNFYPETPKNMKPYVEVLAPDGWKSLLTGPLGAMGFVVPRLDMENRVHPKMHVDAAIIAGADDLKVFKEHKGQIPVIGLAIQEDVVTLIDAGADACVDTSIDLLSLGLLTKNLIKKSIEVIPTELVSMQNGFFIDVGSGGILRETAEGIDTSLNPVNPEVLSFLAKNAGKVVTIEEVGAYIYRGQDYNRQKLLSNIGSAVNRFRNIFGYDSVETGIGFYKLVAQKVEAK